ncbi:MAG TPA: protein kinase, partial [Gemmatimonadaceae bacterium]|nr:protein kinase [Gemmatimonadaceae bacterium]
ARITRQVASALDEAHRHNILHRDVKPENILLTTGGDALLADFGVARPVTRESGATLTADGSAVGTPAYMSPEQITGDRVLDGRSDQYSLACVVYEALVGEAPHIGASVQHIMVKRLTDTPRPARALRPAVPPSWDASLSRALSLAPADRFETVGEFAAALTAAAAFAGVASAPLSAGFLRRRRTALVAAGVVVIAGAAGWWVVRQQRRPTDVTLERSVQLTFSGRIQAPAISPDEKQLAYVTSACHGSQCSYAVELQNVGETDTRRILEGATAAYWLAWSPDRRNLILLGTINGRFGSYLVSTVSGPPRFLTSGYATFFAGGDSLLLTPTPLADSAFWVRVATLDGAVRDSFRIAGPGNGLGLVTAVPGASWFVAMMFVPDGFSYRLVDRRGRERSRISANGFLDRVSNDAIWVETGYGGDPDTRVVRLALDARTGRFTGERKLVVSGALTGFDVTADGGRFIVDRGSPQYDTWVTDLQTAVRGARPSEPPLLSGSTPSMIRLSPNGSRLLVGNVVGTASGERDRLVMMPATGGTGSPVPLRGALLGVAWTDSVDAALLEQVKDTLKFSIVDVRTGARRDELIPDDSVVGSFDWLPPNGWVWIGGNGQRLKFRRTSDTAAHAIETAKWNSSLARVVAARDGRHVAYLGWNSTTWDTLRLATIALDGGAEIPWFATSAEGGRIASLDDGSLFYQVREGSEILTLYHARAPGRVERLGSIQWHAWDVDVSRDLRRAAFTIRDYRADAWLSQVERRSR